MPVTILSRCQRFDLRRVPAAMLTAHLAMICERETIAADNDALATIARAAEGSVRDALSLLDQAAAMTADKLTNALLVDMLGQPDRRESQTILTAALAGDCATALATFENAYHRGSEPEMIVNDLLNLTHLASMQAAGGNDETLIESDHTMVVNLAEAGIARLGRAWQLLLKGHAELEKAPNPAAACEMLIIRLAHAAQMPTPGELMQKLSQTPTTSSIPSAASGAPDMIVPAPSIQNTGEKTEADQLKSDRANLDQLNPTMNEIKSLISIVNLAEANNEMLLAAHIRNHVQLVSLKPGNLQIALVGAAPDQLAGNIARCLSKWTHQRWLVSLSDLGGEKTLNEQQQEQDEKLRNTLASEPLVASILDAFPGASIDEIKTPATIITRRTVNSDDTVFTTNDDGEEMSR